MASNPVIFISSTSDLRSARDLVGKVLYAMGYEPVWQDIEATDGGELIALLRRRLAPSAMVLQLVGRRYGAEPPHPTPEFGRVSYTQFETLEAERVGMKVIYRFLDDGFPTDPAAPELPDRAAMQAAYRQRLIDRGCGDGAAVGNVVELELSIRRISDELMLLRRQSERQQRKVLLLVAGAGVGVLAVAGLVFVAMHRQTKSETQIVEQNSRIVEQRTELHDELAQIREQLALVLAPKQLDAGQKAPEPLAAADIAGAKVLLERGDGAEDRALADIALKKFAEADQIIQSLKAAPGITTATLFRLLTMEGNNWYQAGRPDKSIGPYEQAMALRPDDVKARNHLMLAHLFARLGNVASNRKRAIELGEGTLKLTPAGSADWAMTQNNIGLAWSRLPTGDISENLRNAITYYDRALTVYTKESHPEEWARAHSNLGYAWSEILAGNRTESVQKGMAEYRLAQQVYTKEAFPDPWASTQENLGVALADLPTGNRTQNLQNAIADCSAALTIYTREHSPANWAHANSNLGTFWSLLPTGDRRQNLRQAIESFNAALGFYTPSDFPWEWAMTQVNLGVALYQVPDTDRTQNLQDAISAFRAALTVYTSQDFPRQWCTAQCDLGNALRELPVGDPGENSRQALEAFNAALTVTTKEANPADWADLQNNIAIVWCLLPTGDKTENLQSGIAAFTNVLSVYTQDRYPGQWARTQVNIGVSWASMPSGDRTQNLQNAEAAYEAALNVYTPDVYPRECARTQSRLNAVRAMLSRQ